MKLPQLSLRELFLLVVIAAILCGWWVDQDRIRREREALQASEREFDQERENFRNGTRRITNAQMMVAEAQLQVSELELEGSVAANRKVPGVIPEREIRRQEAVRDIAKLELEKARVTIELLEPANKMVRTTVPTPVNLGP